MGLIEEGGDCRSKQLVTSMPLLCCPYLLFLLAPGKVTFCLHFCSTHLILCPIPNPMDTFWFLQQEVCAASTKADSLSFSLPPQSRLPSLPKPPPSLLPSISAIPSWPPQGSWPPLTLWVLGLHPRSTLLLSCSQGDLAHCQLFNSHLLANDSEIYSPACCLSPTGPISVLTLSK